MNLRCRCSVKFSLSGRDGDSNRFLPSWGIILNTHPSNLIRVASGHLWYSSGTKFMGPSSTALSGSPLYQDINLPLDLRQWLPTHPYYHQSAHFHFPAFSLSWATRLRGQNELSGQLSDRHAFNMTWGRTANRSLTDTDGDRSTPKTSMPCCFSINIPPGLHLY